MMLSELLSYESLKTVLTYIEANKRFEISLKMPSIRKTEKVAPLKIDELSLRSRLFNCTVNQTTYGFEEVLDGYRNYQDYICLASNGRANEYVECNRHLAQRAWKYLMMSFLGGRSVPIIVNHFLFYGDKMLDLPQNAKLQIKHLTIHKGIRQSLRELSAVLTDSSFPLQSLKMFVNVSTEEGFRDKVVQESKKVIIIQDYYSFPTNHENNWNFLPSNTHFENTNSLKPNDLRTLLRHWIDSEAAPGRRCSVELTNNCEDLVWRYNAKTEIISYFVRAKERNGIIAIPLNKSSDVIVYSEDYNGPLDVNNPPKWIFVMEVVAKK